MGVDARDRSRKWMAGIVVSAESIPQGALRKILVTICNGSGGLDSAF